MSFCLLVMCQFFIIYSTSANLNPDGLKCGQQKCSAAEYCSPFDTQCRPCSNICDSTSHNHQPELCAKDCQGKNKNNNFIYYLSIESTTSLKIFKTCDTLFV